MTDSVQDVKRISHGHGGSRVFNRSAQGITIGYTETKCLCGWRSGSKTSVKESLNLLRSHVMQYATPLQPHIPPEDQTEHLFDPDQVGI